MVWFPWVKGGLRSRRVLSKSLVKAFIRIRSMNAGYFWPPLSAWPLEWIAAPVHNALACPCFMYACWNSTHSTDFPLPCCTAPPVTSPFPNPSIIFLSTILYCISRSLNLPELKRWKSCQISFSSMFTSRSSLHLFKIKSPLCNVFSSIPCLCQSLPLNDDASYIFWHTTVTVLLHVHLLHPSPPLHLAATCLSFCPSSSLPR